MILLIDNYDSFTYNLVDYFEQLGVQVEVIQNDTPKKQLQLNKYDGVVISPGPETPEKANGLNEYLPLLIGEIPLLGICLGHQAIASYLGGRLDKASKPMHGKLSEIVIDGGILFNGLPLVFQVVRYHSLLIYDLPEMLIPTAKTKAGELMAFEDLELKVHGMQFHPEAALTEYGLDMLRNWLTFYNIV